MEALQVAGKVTIKVLGQEVVQKNLVVNSGLTKVRDIMMGSERGVPKVAVGTGTSNPSPSDTSLTNSDSYSVTETVASGEFKVKYSYRVGYTESVGKTITEMGLFFGTNLFSRILLDTPIVKTADVQIVGEWELSFSSQQDLYRFIVSAPSQAEIYNPIAVSVTSLNLESNQAVPYEVQVNQGVVQKTSTGFNIKPSGGNFSYERNNPLSYKATQQGSEKVVQGFISLISTPEPFEPVYTLEVQPLQADIEQGKEYFFDCHSVKTVEGSTDLEFVPVSVIINTKAGASPGTGIVTVLPSQDDPRIKVVPSNTAEGNFLMIVEQKEGNVSHHTQNVDIYVKALVTTTTSKPQLVADPAESTVKLSYDKITSLSVYAYVVRNGVSESTVFNSMVVKDSDFVELIRGQLSESSPVFDIIFATYDPDSWPVSMGVQLELSNSENPSWNPAVMNLTFVYPLTTTTTKAPLVPVVYSSPDPMLVAPTSISEATWVLGLVNPNVPNVVLPYPPSAPVTVNIPSTYNGLLTVNTDSFNSDGGYKDITVRVTPLSHWGGVSVPDFVKLSVIADSSLTSVQDTTCSIYVKLYTEGPSPEPTTEMRTSQWSGGNPSTLVPGTSIDTARTMTYFLDEQNQKIAPPAGINVMTVNPGLESAAELYNTINFTADASNNLFVDARVPTFTENPRHLIDRQDVFLIDGEGNILNSTPLTLKYNMGGIQRVTLFENSETVKITNAISGTTIIPINLKVYLALESDNTTKLPNQQIIPLNYDTNKFTVREKYNSTDWELWMTDTGYQEMKGKRLLFLVASSTSEVAPALGELFIE